jgi:hypothetical protein
MCASGGEGDWGEWSLLLQLPYQWAGTHLWLATPGQPAGAVQHTQQQPGPSPTPLSAPSVVPCALSQPSGVRCVVMGSTWKSWATSRFFSHTMSMWPW